MESGGRVRWSPDGAYWWSGTEWIPTVSPDQAWRWNGSAWLPLPVRLATRRRRLQAADWTVQIPAAAATSAIALLARALYDPVLAYGWGFRALALTALVTSLVSWLAIVRAAIIARRRRRPFQLRRLAVLPAVAACLWPVSTFMPSAESNWAESRGAFDRYIDSVQLPPPGEVEDQTPDAPARIGKYKIFKASRVGDAVILYVDTPFELGFFVFRGFAHMPSGPGRALAMDRRLFGAARFTHIEGDWYRWDAVD